MFFVCIFNSFRMERAKLSYRGLFFYIASCIAMMLICSRIAYAVSDIAVTGFSIKGFFQDLIYGGIVFYGGMLGVLAGAAIFAKFTHRSIRLMLDHITPSIPLFHIFGRIGCLFAGCCYGFECSWGVPNEDFPGKLFFPVQAIESLCNLLIFSGLLIMQKVRKSDKYTLEAYLFTYGICRFILELFRGDTGRGIWPDGLSSSQHISIALVIFVAVEMYCIQRRCSFCK